MNSGLKGRHPDGGLRESKEYTYTSDLQVFFLLVTVYSLWLTGTCLMQSGYRFLEYYETKDNVKCEVKREYLNSMQNPGL